MQDIRKKQGEVESGFEKELPGIEQTATAMTESEARKFLTDYSVSSMELTVKTWKSLGEFLLVKYIDGNIKKEENGVFLKNEQGLPPGIIRAGYPEEAQRAMVKENPGLRQKTQAELDQRK